MLFTRLLNLVLDAGLVLINDINDE